MVQTRRNPATTTRKTKVTFCVQGVISPLLSNVYLNEVDRMLERAKERTRNGRYTHVEYARWADDRVPRRHEEKAMMMVT